MTDTEEIVAKILAKREGLSEDEAKAFMSIMKEKETGPDLEQMLGTIGLTGESLSHLSEPAQRAIAPIVGGLIASQGQGRSGEDVDSFVKKMIALKTVLGGGEGGKEVEGLKKDIEELKDALSGKEKEELKEWVMNAIQSIAPQEPRQPNEAQPPKSVTEELKEKLGEYQDLKETLHDLMGVKEEAAKGGLNIKEAKEQLTKMGYKVEGPITPQEFEQRLQMKIDEYEKKMKEKEETMRKDIAKQLKIDQKREEQLMTLGASLLEGVMAALIPSAPKGSAMSALKEAISLAKAKKAEGA